MASIDCAKCTSGQAGGLSVHFDQKKRLELEHSNPHIDKTLTPLNSFHDCAGYTEMLHRQKKRVAEADELHPPGRIRDDRITAILMEIPVPKVISDQGLTDQFLRDAYAMIGEMVGKENMCGMTTHRDEIHDYIDHGGVVRTSLEHGHAMVVPYARWKDKETIYGEDGKPLRDADGKILKREVWREGVNAKHFLTRSFLKKLQDNMQDMVMEKYGISYQTSQEPLHMAVEDLKRESARAAEIINQAEKEATFQHQLADAEAQRATRASQEAENARKRAKAADDYADTLARRNKAVKDALDAQQQRYDRNDEVIQAQEEALKLIDTVEDYEDEALDLIEEIEAAEAMVTKELPKATRLFKSAEANSFVQTMAKILEGIRKHISNGLARLRIFELTHVVNDPLSEPVQRRANDLDNTIASAFTEAQKQPSGGRQKPQERTK